MEHKLEIKNDNGDIKEFDVLFTFESQNKDKFYVIYTDHKKDADGNIIVYSSYYYKEDNEKKLHEVKEKNEIDFINEVCKSIEYDILDKE